MLTRFFFSAFTLTPWPQVDFDPNQSTVIPIGVMGVSKVVIQLLQKSH
jgi:hypothetical protein